MRRAAISTYRRKPAAGPQPLPVPHLLRAGSISPLWPRHLPFAMLIACKQSSTTDLMRQTTPNQCLHMRTGFCLSNGPTLNAFQFRWTSLRIVPPRIEQPANPSIRSSSFALSLSPRRRPDERPNAHTKRLPLRSDSPAFALRSPRRSLALALRRHSPRTALPVCL